jgi:ABC-type Zn uptake system ZnuABC Zn-binding protein ZnuA
MINIRFRKAIMLLMIVFLVASFGPLFAAGGAETQDAVEEHDDHDHDDHDDHDHEGEMMIPDIDPADLSGSSLQVVASTSIVGDVVQKIAGDAADVTVLMALGQNPHSYEPTPREIALVEDSYIVFVNGMDLEEGLMGTIENVARTYIVPVSAGIAVIEGDEHGHGDHDHAAGDPHFWFDPTNVIIWAENIADALISADPANADVYENNRDAYIAELEALDLEVRNLVASIPRSQRKLVVDHVALSYFAEEYGFEIIGEVIPSVSDQAEPSARDIAQLADEIREEGVNAIFIGGTAGRGLQNLVQAVAEEVGRGCADREYSHRFPGSRRKPGRQLHRLRPLQYRADRLRPKPKGQLKLSILQSLNYGACRGDECDTPAVPDSPALLLNNLRFRYPRSADYVLDGVSLSIQPGERVAMVGPNGAGKSTLLHLIIGMEDGQDGTIDVYGNPAHTCRHRVAIVPQRSDVDWRFPVTVRQVVMMGRYVHLGWFRRPRRGRSGPGSGRPGNHGDRFPGRPAGGRTFRRSAAAGDARPDPGPRRRPASDGRTPESRRYRHPGTDLSYPGTPHCHRQDGGGQHP